MFNVVSLLVAAALVSLQSDFHASGALLSNSLDLENSLQPNVIPVAAPPRRMRKYVYINEVPPATARLTPGARLVLECQVMGSPMPTVTWLRNGDPITDYEEDSNEILSAHPSSYAMLMSKLIVTSSENGDVYTCMATAGVNQKSASTTVYTEEEDQPSLLLEKLLIPSKPIITSFYNDVFQNQGTNVVLLCRVAGEAQVFWQDNNGSLIFGNGRRRVLPSGDLLITGLAWSDMGQYNCVAKNAFGQDTSSTFLYPINK